LVFRHESFFISGFALIIRHSKNIIKGSRITFCGDTNRFITTGFSKTSDRQYMIWDARNTAEPIKLENLDTSSGILVPTYDVDTKMLFLAGKGCVPPADKSYPIATETFGTLK
jgi:hypothetical protein